MPPRSCRPPRSRRWATSCPAISRCSAPAATSSRSTSPAACRAPARARARRPGSRPRSKPQGRVEVLDSQTGAGGLGCLVVLAAKLAGGAAGLDADRGGRPHGQGEPRHLVLPGHARVPAPRRADRGGAGARGDSPEGQADPHVRHGDRARRSRAHAPARARADGRLPARAARAGRERLDRPARPGGRRRRAAREPREPRCSGSGRCSAPRSARCSARTSARGCSSAGSPRRRRSGSGRPGPLLREPGRACPCTAQPISFRNGTRCLKNSLISGVAPAGSL